MVRGFVNLHQLTTLGEEWLRGGDKQEGEQLEEEIQSRSTACLEIGWDCLGGVVGGSPYSSLLSMHQAELGGR